MNAEWIGRRLVQASSALAERHGEQHPHPVLGPIATELLGQIGEAIASGDTSVRRPLARTRGVLRLPAKLDLDAFVAEYQGLAKLVHGYLAHLPGITPETDKYARACLQHAARAIADLHKRLLAGQPVPGHVIGGPVLIEPAVVVGTATAIDTASRIAG